jgi:hypothetical protein
MLRWGWRLLVLALMASGWTLTAAALHVVVVPGEDLSRDELSVLVVPKNRITFADTYADTREWSAAEVAEHQALVSRLVEAGHSERLAHVLLPEQRRRLEEMLRIRQSVTAAQR